MRGIKAPDLLTVMVLGVLVSPASLLAQAQAAPAAPAKSVVIQALLKDIGQLEEKIIGLAEAIPEASYAWSPSEGVRSVGQVMMHVAADNYFIPTIAGVAAPAATGIKAGDYPSVQAYEGKTVTKTQAVEAMRESFAHLRTAMQAVDDAALAQTQNVFGMQMTGLDLWILATTHLHEHLGQSIAYARANKVVPPWSRGG